MLVMAMVAVVLIASSPRSEIVFLDSCDYVEINHVYNINEETGESSLRMIQYIWWEWKNNILLPSINRVTKQKTGEWEQGSTFVVREYLVTYSGSSSPTQVAYVSSIKSNDKYECVFWDRADKVLRRVICKWSTITHTTYDVEIENRSILDMNSRNKFHKR